MSASDVRHLLIDPRAIVLGGDACHVARTLQADSVDAIVTDPPAGIAFMGKGWDTDKGGRDAWVTWLAAIMRNALHVLKPGGHALVWALPRTSHWTATAVEDAGFEIRDVVTHLFGTGFPKSKNIDGGRGTALKPASEHWILARKPLVGTVAANVLAHGTGAMNIDACRIETSDNPNGGAYSGGTRPTSMAGLTGEAGGTGSLFEAGGGRLDGDAYVQPAGRWPANVTLDEDAADVLDAQSGTRKSGARRAGTPRGPQGIVYKKGFTGQPMRNEINASEGGASRFFYVAKGARAEKDAGLEHLPARAGGARNHHPTVKSIALMRWLVRLVTPPGGVVLDLFAGSGTTGVAALAEGRTFIGFEQGGEGGEYWPILVGRIQHALKGTP